MKKFICFLLCFLLLLSSAHAEKSLGISRTEFLGKLFEASHATLSGHHPTPQIYSCIHESDHYLYYLDFSDTIALQITCPIVGDEVQKIIVGLANGDENDAWEFMLLMTEIAYTLGVVSNVDSRLSISQDNFLRNIGFTAENPIIDGKINSYSKGGNIYWWQYVKDYGAFVFCVEPE